MSVMYVTSAWKATGVKTNAEPTTRDVSETEETTRQDRAYAIGEAVLSQLSAVREAHFEVGRHELTFTVAFT